MKLGANINRMREAAGVSAQDLADSLGIDPDKLEKWEKGEEDPPCFYLLPLSVVLGTSTDVLLAEEEVPSDAQIHQIVFQIHGGMQTQPYHSVFEWAQRQILRYPSSISLIFSVAQVLNSYIDRANETESESFRGKIHAWYERVAQSDHQALRPYAIQELFYESVALENYEKASDYIDRLPQSSEEAVRFRTYLNSKMQKTETKMEVFERQIFSGYQEVSEALGGLCTIAIASQDFERAEHLVQLQEQLAALLDMGEYMRIVSRLELAVALKHNDECLQILERLIESAEHLTDFKESWLYQHMTFRDPNQITTRVLENLKNGIANDEKMDFIRQDPKYHEIMEKLDQLCFTTVL